MSSLLEQSLQIVLQETTAIGVLAVLAAGMLGVSVRRLVGAESAREADPGQPSEPTSEDVDRRIVFDGGGRRRDDPDEEEFEQRLDTLESEVDHLSSTVQSVQTENEEIAESVEEVNGNLQRLLDLSGNLARGINPFSSSEEGPEDTLAGQSRDSTADEPEDAFQRNARRETNPDVTHTDGEPVNRHQPVQHDKVETIPGGTGAAEEFDRMEEEVEELDTLSFSDDVEGGFGERAEEDLGTEEVIAGSEPAPTEDAIGDGGTLIETKEEELDIEPGSVSDPANPTDSPESPPAESQPDVESGFEFGAKAAESESGATDDEPTAFADEDEQATAADRPAGAEEPPAPAEPAASEETAEFEELAAEVEESTETADTESTPLDDQTEAELAAAEAAFAAEFDAEDDLSLDLDTPAESNDETQESHEETPAPADDQVETAGSAAVEESSDSRSIFDFESVAQELDESDLTTEELAESSPATEEPAESSPATEEPAESSPATEEPEPSVTVEADSQSVSLEPEESAEEQQTNAETATESEPSVRTTPSARSLGEHLSVTEGGKPYIESLPEGYSTELLVVEWLESLVDDIGVHGTARAIQYYESLEWITADVAEQLDAYLHAFESGDADTLGADQHLRSLEYVDELARSESEDNE